MSQRVSLLLIFPSHWLALAGEKNNNNAFSLQLPGAGRGLGGERRHRAGKWSQEGGDVVIAGWQEGQWLY